MRNQCLPLMLLACLVAGCSMAGGLDTPPPVSPTTEQNIRSTLEEHVRDVDQKEVPIRNIVLVSAGLLDIESMITEDILRDAMALIKRKTGRDVELRLDKSIEKNQVFASLSNEQKKLYSIEIRNVLYKRSAEVLWTADHCLGPSSSRADMKDYKARIAVLERITRRLERSPIYPGKEELYQLYQPAFFRGLREGGIWKGGVGVVTDAPFWDHVGEWENRDFPFLVSGGILSLFYLTDESEAWRETPGRALGESEMRKALVLALAYNYALIPRPPFLTGSRGEMRECLSSLRLAEKDFAHWEAVLEGEACSFDTEYPKLLSLFAKAELSLMDGNISEAKAALAKLKDMEGMIVTIPDRERYSLLQFLMAVHTGDEQTARALAGEAVVVCGIAQTPEYRLLVGGLEGPARDLYESIVAEEQAALYKKGCPRDCAW